MGGGITERLVPRLYPVLPRMASTSAGAMASMISQPSGRPRGRCIQLCAVIRWWSSHRLLRWWLSRRAPWWYAFTRHRCVAVVAVVPPQPASMASGETATPKADEAVLICTSQIVGGPCARLVAWAAQNGGGVQVARAAPL